MGNKGEMSPFETTPSPSCILLIKTISGVYTGSLISFPKALEWVAESLNGWTESLSLPPLDR
jgi:hypothetical protein